MGQRHQIYARIEGQDGTTVGLHHQWLYGRIACIQAVRFATLWTRMGKHGRGAATKDTLREMLRSAYQVNPELGYFHRVHDLSDEECADPRQADNNDGITVFEVGPKGIAYGMMSLGNLEGERGAGRPEPLEPATMERYVRSYYPESGAWTQRASAKEVLDVEREIAGIVRKSKKFRLLTREHCEGIFPEMYAEFMSAAAD